MSRNLLIKLASCLPVGSDSRKILLNAARSNRTTTPPTIFHFRTQALKDLWEEELRGQISDGLFASKGRNEFWFWKDLVLVVGGGKTEITGAENYARFGLKLTTFNFTDPRLLDAVGDRMLEIIQRSEPRATQKDLVKYLGELKKAAPEFSAKVREAHEAKQKAMKLQESLAYKN